VTERNFEWLFAYSRSDLCWTQPTNKVALIHRRRDGKVFGVVEMEKGRARDWKEIDTRLKLTVEDTLDDHPVTPDGTMQRCPP
jgi:hypothetical protein